MTKIADWQFECFAEWLPVERWNEETILTDPEPRIGFKRYCKICDQWVLMIEGEKHVKDHVKDWKSRRKKMTPSKAEILAKAREAKRLKREAALAAAEAEES